MLLTHPSSGRFTTNPITDATTSTEVITAISADTPETADAIADRAVAAGGRPHEHAMDVPGMHGRAFTDPDGHQWEVLHTDPAVFSG